MQRFSQGEYSWNMMVDCN